MARKSLEQVLFEMNVDPNDKFQVSCAWAVSRIYVLEHKTPAVEKAYEVFCRERTEAALTDLHVTIGIAERLQRKTMVN